MTAETKESLRQRLTAIRHKDRWDDRDRKEVRAIQAALSALAQHIPEPHRERSSGCRETQSKDGRCAERDGSADESASPSACKDRRETDASAGQASRADGCGTDTGCKTGAGSGPHARGGTP